MHDLLVRASEANPVPGNAHGSYLTIRSKDGLIFGVINVIGNFATVFNDQAYWQRAIASKPSSCVKAYLLGGLAWMSIPLMFATTLGLAAVALTGDPAMKVLTPADVSAGLPAPAAAAALLGKGGAAAMLVLLFLAVTSATSAELIAVSSILTYDVYKVFFLICFWGRIRTNMPHRDTSTLKLVRPRFCACRIIWLLSSLWSWALLALSSSTSVSPWVGYT